ncbi:MAG: flagellar basal body rod protein FlgB [Verrucomicrobiota bacterium]
MIDPIFPSNNYEMARKLLDVSAQRHEAIAANLANAETPGYHRVDVAPDFERELKQRVANGGSLRGIEALNVSVAEDPAARNFRPDGNNVELEHELMAMSRNTMEYDYLTEIVSGNLKQLKLAIAGHL